MATFLYSEINFFAMGILILIIISLRRVNANYFLGQKLFLFLILSNVLMLIFDTLMWNVDGRTGVGFKEMNLLSTLLYYVLSPIPAMLWALYCEYQVNRNEKRILKLYYPFAFLIIINAVLSFMSLSNNVLFYIDSNNMYHRGKFFFIMALVSYFFLIYAFIFVICKKRKISKDNFIPFLVFPLVPILGGVVQILVYGISLIWICTTISLLVIYIYAQNEQIHTDSLTGLYNRRQFDIFLEDRFRNHSTKPIAGIMIDINMFKKINDEYGHIVGDHALEHTAEILRRSTQPNDFVARFGGDEFVIILAKAEKNELQKTILKINENTSIFNAEKKAPYKIDLSMGSDIINPENSFTEEQFIMHIDKLMYDEKKKKSIQ